ncbi:MAG: response regulator transcription factor [Bilophila sp.]
MIADAATILVVEDEQDIRELLVYNLEREGYTTLQAKDGKEGLERARSRKPDLILLDLMLPKMDGLAVCRELERDTETVHIPVIMLTARGEDVDRILGFELGADDYVVKPFNVRELLLRIRAILRRQVQAEQNPVHTRHGVSINPTAHKVTVLGHDVELTATEFRLADDLLRNAGRVRTREELLAAVWGYQFEGYARTVDTHIRRLRTKLGVSAEIIETVRGVGYRCKE